MRCTTTVISALVFSGAALFAYPAASTEQQETSSTETCDDSRGVADIQLAATYYNLGLFHQDQGDYAQAEAYYQQCLAVQEALLPPDHPDLAAIYHNLGCTYQNLNDFEQAISYYQRCLNVEQSILPSNHPDLAITHYNLGALYLELGDRANAEQHVSKALAIQKRIRGADYSHTIALQKKLASLGENPLTSTLKGLGSFLYRPLQGIFGSAELEASAPTKKRRMLTDTRIHKAAAAGNAAVVEQLVNDFISRQHDKGLTEQACQETLEALLNMRDNAGLPPLYHAARNGHYGIVDYLCEHGANIDGITRSGRSLAQQALRDGDFKLVLFFLERGADVNHVNKNGYTLLHGAVTSKSLSIDDKIMLIQIIVGRGADVNAQAKGGYTPLHLAITPLHFSVRKRMCTLNQLLLSPHVNPNILNEVGFSPFHDACTRGNVEMVEALYERGADLSLKAVASTPLQLAERYGSKSVVAFLKEKQKEISCETP